MSIEPYSYSIFFEFIESYLASSFLDINADDPILRKMEDVMDADDQFFSVMDMEQKKFLFTSKGILRMLGIEPEQRNPVHFLIAVHPEDKPRLAWAAAHIFEQEYKIFASKMGTSLMSYTLRLRNSAGDFINLFIQDNLFLLFQI